MKSSEEFDDNFKMDRHSITISISLIGVLLILLFIILNSIGVTVIIWFWVFFYCELFWWIIPAAAFGLVLLWFLIALPFVLMATKDE